MKTVSDLLNDLIINATMLEIKFEYEKTPMIELPRLLYDRLSKELGAKTQYVQLRKGRKFDKEAIIYPGPINNIYILAKD